MNILHEQKRVILFVTDGEDDTFGLNDVDSSGWYASAVYEINPKMRAGIRYSKLGSPDFSNANNNDGNVVGPDYRKSTKGNLRVMIQQLLLT